MVKRCPSFNDTVLHMMTPREDGTHNCARNMVSLTIVDCQNFSVAALRQLVSAKSRVESLRVFGRAPVISDEDFWWLSENTGYFDY
jgi:hypothetical protein